MSSEIEAIKAAEAQLIEAAKANNADSITALLHDELRFVLPSGQIITKAMEYDAYTQQLMRVDSLLPAEQEISLMGDIAVVTVKVKLQGSYKLQPINGDFLYLRIWKQTGAGWQVIAGSCTPLAAE